MTIPNHDDADHLRVPAGPLRLAIGLAAMPGSSFLAALNDSTWVKCVGLALFVASVFIMLRPPPVTPN